MCAYEELRGAQTRRCIAPELVRVVIVSGLSKVCGHSKLGSSGGHRKLFPGGPLLQMVSFLSVWAEADVVTPDLCIHTKSEGFACAARLDLVSD
jgi:hypothetical protein